jgi:hypothetical protein
MSDKPKAKCVVCQSNLGEQWGTSKTGQRTNGYGQRIDTEQQTLLGLFCPKCGLSYKQAPMEFLEKQKVYEAAKTKESEAVDKMAASDKPMFKAEPAVPGKKKAKKKAKSILEADDDDDKTFGLDEDDY